MRVVLLDTGVLGLVTNPRATPENDDCKQWMQAHLASGVAMAIPEIADYELRRELLLHQRQAGLRRLDALKAVTRYLPLTTETMLQAAEYWAQVRRQGRPTAGEQALDGDVILAAQATLA